MGKYINPKVRISPLILLLLLSPIVCYSQEIDELWAFKMQKQLKNKTTGEISILQDWSKCSFIISLNMKDKEIEFLNNNSTVITWFTILSKDEALSDEATSMVTFNCLDKMKKTCKVTLAMSDSPAIYFAMIILTYQTDTGIIVYGYQTQKK